MQEFGTATYQQGLSAQPHRLLWDTDPKETQIKMIFEVPSHTSHSIIL